MKARDKSRKSGELKFPGDLESKCSKLGSVSPRSFPIIARLHLQELQKETVQVGIDMMPFG